MFVVKVTLVQEGDTIETKAEFEFYEDYLEFLSNMKTFLEKGFEFEVFNSYTD